MFVHPQVFGSLWREANDFRQQMDRVFGLGNGVPTGVAPALNVWEDEGHYYAEADLPDVPPERLEFTVKEGIRLSIQGERKTVDPANAVWHRQERFAGTFSRELALPTPVDPDKVEAKFEYGVLKLTLPKSETAKPRKIAVKAE